MSRKIDQTTAICQIVRYAKLLRRHERLFHYLTKRYVDYIAKIYDFSTDETIVFALTAYYNVGKLNMKEWCGIDNIHSYRYYAAYNRLKARMFFKERLNDASLKKEVIDAIVSNNSHPSPFPTTQDELFRDFETLLDNEKDNRERIVILDDVKDKSDLELFRTLRGYDLKGYSLLLYIFLCYKYINGYNTVSIASLCENGIIPKYMISCFQEKGLFAAGLVEHGKNGGYSDLETLCLSRKGIQVLSGRKISDKLVMPHADIKECRLYFNDGLRRQIDEVCALVGEESYRNICARLTDRSMRLSFCVLFYGEPGTGKTESVLQIAKRTGRDIIKVDMSKLKDCYVGESEKNVKEVFDNYRDVAKNSDTTPILLLNEADAIIGKRLENVSASVDKMENAIQNIILDEMENFEGILFATTNFLQNFDKAFERRFLYKVKFEKPTEDVRCEVFSSKMPYLEHDVLQTLSGRYDFSGGQIENVARKCEIDRILYGNDSLTMDKVDEICKEEVVGKKHGKIGF